MRRILVVVPALVVAVMHPFPVRAALPPQIVDARGDQKLAELGTTSNPGIDDWDLLAVGFDTTKVRTISRVRGHRVTTMKPRDFVLRMAMDAMDGLDPQYPDKRGVSGLLSYDVTAQTTCGKFHATAYWVLDRADVDLRSSITFERCGPAGGALVLQPTAARDNATIVWTIPVSALPVGVGSRFTQLAASVSLAARTASGAGTDPVATADGDTRTLDTGSSTKAYVLGS